MPTSTIELLSRHGIKLGSTSTGRHYATCPQCSATRSGVHKNNKVLGVTIDSKGVRWGCNHCGWTGPEKGSGKGSASTREPLTTHYYRDHDGTVRFRKVRNLPGRTPKCWFEHPNGKGAWLKGAGGVDTKILYRLDDVAKAIEQGRVIAVVEGEKDADSVAALGFVATCNAHGASEPGKRPKWMKVHSEQLAGADIVVLNDNDPAGYEHADATCKLSLGIAKRVRRLDLAPHWPNMPKGADISDWLALGHTKEELGALLISAPDYVPTPSAKEEASPSNGTGIDDNAELERLARLAPLDYERARKEAGEKLGIKRLSLLDSLVKAKRAELGLDEGDGKAGHPIEFATPEPWPEPVDGPALLDALSAAIGNHVIMEKRFCDSVALWIVHTYLLNHFQVTPRLAIRSPVKRCGKSTLLDVLRCLVFHPLPTSSVTASVTFRVIEKHRPCVLIDEADMLLRSKDESKDLYSVLLDGHRRGGQTLRNVGDDHEPRGFNTYAAIAIASIGKLLDTLTDRSIVIDLKRRKQNEKVTRFRFDRVDHLTMRARQIMRWVTDHGERVAELDPTMPDNIFDREADNWRPLLMVADAVGGEWRGRARNAALAACGVEDADEEGYLELLLRDIRDVFDGLVSDKDRISSAHLIERLVQIVPRPWAEYGRSGKPLSQNGLARLLKPLGIKPQVVRIGSETPSGYYRHQFEEAWERFLTLKGAPQPQHLNKCDEMGTSDTFPTSTRGSDVEVGKSQKSNNDGLCLGVEVVKGENGASTRGDEPGLSRRQLQEWADGYSEAAYANARNHEGDTHTAELDAELRRRLLAEGVFPEHVEREFERVMELVFRV